MEPTLAKGAARPVEEPAGEKLPKGVVRIAANVTMTDPAIEGLGHRRNPLSGSGTSTLVLAIYYPARSDYVSTTTRSLPANLSDARIGASFRDTLGSEYEIHVLRVPATTPEHPERWLDEQLERLGPWHRKRWFMELMPRWIEHLPAPSTTLDGLLAYYQTPQKRLAGIRTPIKAGKYLKKYFGDVLSEEEIQKYGLEWQNACSPAKLNITQDADEIEAVYKGGPYSCMVFRHDEYDGDYHPARVYAGPDLGIAYIGPKEKAEARMVVWPEKLIYYPKRYGDYHRLGLSLQAAGYREGVEDDFAGARIQRIYNDKYDFFTVPYCDLSEELGDDGRYLRIGGGDVFTQQTNGTNKEHPRNNPRVYCTDCDVSVDEDDAYYVIDHGHVCPSCWRESHSFVCEITGDRYGFDDNEMVPSHEDYPISEYATRAYPSRVFHCAESGRYYPTAHFDHFTLSDGRVVEAETAQDQGLVFLCEFSDDWFDIADRRELDDGRVYSAINCAAAGFEAWQGDALVIGRDEHPDQSELTLEAA